jgi:hypothetical protein
MQLRLGAGGATEPCGLFLRTSEDGGNVQPLERDGDRGARVVKVLSARPLWLTAAASAGQVPIKRACRRITWRPFGVLYVDEGGFLNS